jgi:hypothetical protein
LFNYANIFSLNKQQTNQYSNSQYAKTSAQLTRLSGWRSASLENRSDWYLRGEAHAWGLFSRLAARRS